MQASHSPSCVVQKCPSIRFVHSAEPLVHHDVLGRSSFRIRSSGHGSSSSYSGYFHGSGATGRGKDASADGNDEAVALASLAK